MNEIVENENEEMNAEGKVVRGQVRGPDCANACEIGRRGTWSGTEKGKGIGGSGNWKGIGGSGNWKGIGGSGNWKGIGGSGLENGSDLDSNSEKLAAFAFSTFYFQKSYLGCLFCTRT
jgi:hypothetical protein